MSERIRETLADLEHDTAALKLAPPAHVRARGETLRRRRVAGGAAAAAVLTVAGVLAAVSATADRGANLPPTLVGASAATSAVKADCGSHVLGQGERLPDAAIACFLDAVQAHRPARLAQTRPTVEGDPIQTLYVAGADGAVQVTIDARQDPRAGSQRVIRQTCTGPVREHGFIGFTQCSAPEPAST